MGKWNIIDCVAAGNISDALHFARTAGTEGIVALCIQQLLDSKNVTHAENCVGVEVKDSGGDAIIRGNAGCKQHTFVFERNKEAVVILGCVRARDDTNTDFSRQMSVDCWPNVVVLQEDWSRRRAFASAVKQKVGIHADSKGNIVLSREVAVCKLPAINSDLCFTKVLIVNTIKHIRYLVVAAMVTVPIEELFNCLWIGEEAL
jgi:hypothetical protein